LLTISGSALNRGTSTACLSLSGWSVTVVDHDSWPGALPAITWLPPSAGIERFHSAGSSTGVSHDDPMIRKAAAWLASIQNKDGGWGEDGASYKLDYAGYEPAPSTSSQTAWALLGLMAAGEIDHPAVARGVAYLAATQNARGQWDEELYTATGFPRVFYLRYHGYRKFFPLWAMARYRNLKAGNAPRTAFGM